LFYSASGWSLSTAKYNELLYQLANGQGGIPANTNWYVNCSFNQATEDSSEGGFDGESALQYLVNSLEWIINDGHGGHQL
jgi:hypothetical protein